MRTYCMAQATYSVLSGDLSGKEIPNGKYIYIYIYICMCVCLCVYIYIAETFCFPQHCKATIHQ